MIEIDLVYSAVKSKTSLVYMRLKKVDMRLVCTSVKKVDIGMVSRSPILGFILRY